MCSHFGQKFSWWPIFQLWDVVFCPCTAHKRYYLSLTSIFIFCWHVQHVSVDMFLSSSSMIYISTYLMFFFSQRRREISRLSCTCNPHCHLCQTIITTKKKIKYNNPICFPNRNLDFWIFVILILVIPKCLSSFYED